MSTLVFNQARWESGVPIRHMPAAQQRLGQMAAQCQLTPFFLVKKTVKARTNADKSPLNQIYLSGTSWRDGLLCYKLAHVHSATV